MIKNIEDELYQVEKKQAKIGRLLLILGKSQEAKNALKLSSKYLKDRICKIKQYLNNICMIINQNILEILRAFLNLEKNMKNSKPSKLPQLPLLNVLGKLLTEIKYLINTLIFVRRKYLQMKSYNLKILKQIINFQQNR